MKQTLFDKPPFLWTSVSENKVGYTSKVSSFLQKKQNIQVAGQMTPDIVTAQEVHNHFNTKRNIHSTT